MFSSTCSPTCFPPKETLKGNVTICNVQISLHVLNQTQYFVAGTNGVSNKEFTCELTPSSRVLLEKLTVPQLDKKLPKCYGT